MITPSFIVVWEIEMLAAEKVEDGPCLNADIQTFTVHCVLCGGADLLELQPEARR